MPDDPSDRAVPGPAVEPAADGGRGADTDGDGRPDTLLEAEGADLLVRSDLDGDGLADRVLRIGPDATVDVVAVPSVPLWRSAPTLRDHLLGDLFDDDGWPPG